ncbi:MAG: O-antigen ligase family protein [Chloroflexi bacterium]|nr:O-antigen ligase family protein [Chloroflexota bacterium]
MSFSLRKAWGWLLAALWALLLLCLPVTSFPYFPRVIGGGALVRPLSVYPLVALVILFTLPRLLRRPAPRTLLALLPFVLAAVASSLFALLRGVEPIAGVTSAERSLRVLATLAIGVGFFYTVALFPRSWDDLRAALRWIYAGFSVALLWGSLQAVNVIHYNPEFFHRLSRLQAYVSTRKLFPVRISGMTYEPNWFAVQISSLLLPFLLAAVISGQSAFRWRWRWLTLEWLLLLWSVTVLVFTFSRAGLGLLVMLVFLSLAFFWRPRSRQAKPGAPRRVRAWALRLAGAAAGVALVVGLIFALGMRNSFFARLWNYWGVAKEASLTGYFEYLGFGARFTYGEAAFETYTAYPWLGVGPGNFAFYFDEMMPDRPLAAMPELLKILVPGAGRDRLITAKNYYYRILAEMGLVGAAAFVAFLAAMLGCALSLLRSSRPEIRVWGMAGLLGWAAFIISAISFDSFAVPNMWVVFGLVASAAWIATNEPQGEP